MIPLQKTPQPDILARNGEAWTRVIVEKIARGELLTQAEKTRYRHPQIKEALVQETHGKCAYCESKLRHIHHGDIEHIHPKSLLPERTVLWENLTLACEVCNQNKSVLDPNHEQIIDPYVIDPSDHLKFAGALVYPLGTRHGQSTRQLLDLNRPALAEMRKEHLDRLMGLYDTILRQDLPLATRRAIYDDLKLHYVEAPGQYAAMARSLVEQMKSLVGPELEPPANN